MISSAASSPQPEGLLTRKYRHRFHLLDANRNGHLDLADYLIIADRLTTGLGLHGDAAARVTATYRDLFRSMHRAGDHDGDGFVTEDEYVRTAAASLLGREDGFDRAVLPVIITIMEAASGTRDPCLDRTQFRAFLTAEGVDDPDDVLADLLPSTHRTMGLERLVRLSREFYCSPDPEAPGNRLLGWPIGP